MSARIVPRFPQMELRTLRSNLFCSVLGQLSEPFIGHIVEGKRLFQREGLGQHRHIKFHVGLDPIQDDLGTLLDNLVIVEKIKEEEHVLMLVLVRGHPIPELLTGARRIKLIVHGVAHKRDALHHLVLLLLALEDGGAPDHHLVHGRPQLLLVLLLVRELRNLQIAPHQLPVQTVRRLIEEFVFG